MEPQITHNTLSRVLPGLLVSVYLKTLKSIKMSSVPISLSPSVDSVVLTEKRKAGPRKWKDMSPAQRSEASDVK